MNREAFALQEIARLLKTGQEVLFVRRLAAGLRSGEIILGRKGSATDGGYTAGEKRLISSLIDAASRDGNRLELQPEDAPPPPEVKPLNVGDEVFLIRDLEVQRFTGWLGHLFGVPADDGKLTIAKGTRGKVLSVCDCGCCDTTVRFVDGKTTTLDPIDLDVINAQAN